MKGKDRLTDKYKEVDELETHFEKWMYVLKNLNRLDNIPEKLQEKIFEKMFAAAEIAKLTEKEYIEYIDSLNSYRDYKNTLDYARAEGKAEGLTEGEVIGENKKAIIIANNLLAKGMSKEDVVEATGLTEDEIEQLIKK